MNINFKKSIIAVCIILVVIYMYDTYQVQQKQIVDFKLQISDLEKKLNEKNIEILSLERELDNKTSIITNL